jgi:hypothetical protein
LKKSSLLPKAVVLLTCKTLKKQFSFENSALSFFYAPAAVPTTVAHVNAKYLLTI